MQFWNSWFKPAGSSRKWTLEELRELYDVLLRNGVVTEHNRAVVVETIRTIAEYILWGDQNEPRIFDFFLEHNILTYLHKVLLQPSNRSGEVAKQVLQTLSIIIQNVRSETGIFFLFSNNHLNSIIDLDYEWSDEEVLGHYVSLLKTISLKLNAGTVHFFLNASSSGRSFPLYTRAIRLAHNREGMVRAAVRTLTLNVYSVCLHDSEIQGFVTSAPACGYFQEVAQYLAEQVQLLDRHLGAAEAGGGDGQALASLDSQLAETEDVLSYISDLLSLGVPGISQLLADSFWQWVVRPLLLRPLMQPPGSADHGVVMAANTSSSSSSGALHHSRSAGSGGRANLLNPTSYTPPPGGSQVGSPAAAGVGSSHVRHWSWGSSSRTPDASKQSGAARVRPVCSVFVLERVFLLVSYQPLLQQLLLALACDASIPAAADVSSTSHPLEDSGTGSRAGASSSGTVSSSCRGSLLGMLTSGQPLPVLLVLRLLVAVVNSRHLPAELLSALSLLPRKHLQQQLPAGGSSSLEALVQDLLQQLQAAADAARVQQPDRQQRCGDDGLLLLLLTEHYLPQQSSTSSSEAPPAPAAAAVFGNSDDGSSDGGCLQQLDHWAAAGAQQQQQAGDLSSSSSSRFAGFGPQLLSCLLPLLQLPSLPPLGLWLLGWLLHQLLPAAAAIGAAATAADGGWPAGGAATSAAAGGEGLQQHALSRSSSSSSRGSDIGGGSSSSSSSSSRHRRDSSAGAAELQQDGSADLAAAGTGSGCFAGPPLSTTRAVSVQSSLGLEPHAAMLTAPQQQQLHAALHAARAAFAQQLDSMWCEAVFPLLALEWPAAREVLLRPVLRASSSDLLSGTAVWPVLRHLQQQAAAARQQQQQQGGGGSSRADSGGQSVSAQAALECYLAVQRVVALTQVHELLRLGCVACAPPVPTVSEADLKQVDIQEGYQVDLAPGAALPCVVSFAPGQERRVYFAVAGLSRQQMAALQGPAVSSSSNSRGGAAAVSDTASAGGGGLGHASLLRSLPVAVLADPSPSRPQAGVVLSVAPLLGARPYTDAQVGKWLHVHVRPSVRGLLRVIKTASGKKGGLLSAMRQLADGHWVLAFSSADKSSLAVTMVQQHAGRLQGLYGDALGPLCGHAGGGAHGQQQQQHMQQQQQQQEEDGDEPVEQQQQQQQQQQQEQQQQEQAPVPQQQPLVSNTEAPEPPPPQPQQQEPQQHTAQPPDAVVEEAQQPAVSVEEDQLGVEQLARDVAGSTLSAGTDSQPQQQHLS